jgi:hypothetical protein
MLAEPAEPDHGDGRGFHLQGVPQHERPDVQVRQLQFLRSNISSL